jgi:hypothetical protein
LRSISRFLTMTRVLGVIAVAELDAAPLDEHHI